MFFFWKSYFPSIESIWFNEQNASEIVRISPFVNDISKENWDRIDLIFETNLIRKQFIHVWIFAHEDGYCAWICSVRISPCN